MAKKKKTNLRVPTRGFLHTNLTVEKMFCLFYTISEVFLLQKCVLHSLETNLYYIICKQKDNNIMIPLIVQEIVLKVHSC